jgi:poly-beta-1,6-N-acetyl-D-glucosamine biosynthesis protein PgaD
VTVVPEKMIINARRDLGWRSRLVSDVLTACLWGGWILLWIPVFRKLHQVIRLRLDFGLAAKEVLDTVTPISIVRSLIALLGTSALLLLWSLLPKRQVGEAHAFRSIDDYAHYFNLDESSIVDGSNSRICVVCHDEDGGITGIEVKS